MQNFLENCNLPALNQEDSNFLNKEISLEEITETITSLKSGKTPGPDGYPSEFYKTFSNMLSPYLHKMLVQANEDGVLPSTLDEAFITVIHKKGKDPEEVGSYRPISLLNTDQKILAKTLANRLSTLIGKLVHSDQTGFIPNRNSFFNLRRLFNIMYSQRLPNVDLAVISLDAEKAFDQVEWPYLFKVLQKFNIGDGFIKWIQLLYRHPCARILTNQSLSPRFNLHRGTRQGCALSPMLFALIIEPLAQAIRSHAAIHGYNTKHTLNKISLYADDILLYVTEPQDSIPAILEVINLFGTFSGYRINWNKSELMPIRLQNTSWLEHLPLKLSSDKFTYLGIVVTKQYSLLFKENFPSLMQKLKANIQFWRTLPISLLGRINAIKMVFLPQLLYLYQNIPIFIPKAFHKQLDSIINPFIWDYKTHRIGKKHLCKSKLEGGLSLPNFIFYYWAANLRAVTFLLDDALPPPSWLSMEREECHPFSIGAVILSPVNLEMSLYRNNPIIHSTVRIWKQIKVHFDLRPISFMLPVARNPSFAPSNLDNTFERWGELGISTIGDLYIGGTFASFESLRETYNLPRSNFFRYLQIRDYVRKYLPTFGNAKPSMFDGCIKICPTSDKLISRIYDAFQSVSAPSTDAIKAKWEEELGTDISVADWEDSLVYIHTCSINSRHRLIQFKVLHRLHYSKTKLHRIFPGTSPMCDKCQAEQGTLLHCFALCSNFGYWCGIFGVLSEVLETSIDPDPLLIILGVSDSLNGLTNSQKQLISYSLISAKKLILLFWKKREAPSTKLWLSELANTVHLEIIRYILNNK
uniref:Reverse transcriptase domain-containing protein n=1 Tax=Salmo trutta TaxID=8032 RepID=A0A673WU00_SALTR